VFEKNKLRPGYIYATMHPKAGAVDCVRCSSKNKKAQTQQRQWGWRRHGWDAGAASERTRREIREMLRRNCLPALQRYSARATGRGPFRALAAHLAPYPRVRLLLLLRAVLSVAWEKSGHRVYRRSGALPGRHGSLMGMASATRKCG
jgi:hypothetical protein